jgi:hypothetical protein
VDPIAIVAVGTVWVVAMFAGALIAVGVVEMVTGRVVINLRRIDWSEREAIWLGLTRMVQGLSFGLWALLSILTVVGRIIPVPGAGTPWMIFVSAPFYVTFMAMVVVQALLESRHKRQRPARDTTVG